MIWGWAESLQPIFLLAVIPTFRVMAIHSSGTRCVSYLGPIIQE